MCISTLKSSVSLQKQKQAHQQVKGMCRKKSNRTLRKLYYFTGTQPLKTGNDKTYAITQHLTLYPKSQLMCSQVHRFSDNDTTFDIFPLYTKTMDLGKNEIADVQL